MKEIYNEIVDWKSVKLYDDGTFLIDGVKEDWYKDEKTGLPWIPKKRKTFISLVKQHLRD